MIGSVHHKNRVALHRVLQTHLEEVLVVPLQMCIKSYREEAGGVMVTLALGPKALEQIEGIRRRCPECGSESFGPVLKGPIVAYPTHGKCLDCGHEFKMEMAEDEKDMLLLVCVPNQVMRSEA